MDSFLSRRLILLFLGSVLLRQCLEYWVSFPPLDLFWIDLTTFLHATLFYFVFFVFLSASLSYFTGWSFSVAISRVFRLSPLLLIAPFLDVLFYGRYTLQMGYHIIPFSDFFAHFISFFGPMVTSGVTFGMRIQVLGLLGIFALWVYRAKHSIGDALIATLSQYGLIYLIASAPSVIGWMEFLIRFTDVDVFSALYDSVNQSIARVHRWGVSDALTILRFNVVMIQIWFIALTLFFAFRSRTVLRAVYSWARVWRAGVYVALFLLGSIVAFYASPYGDVTLTIASLISLVAGMVAVLTAWTYAFVLNDLHDIAADRVVHENRALIEGRLTREAAHSVIRATCLLAGLGGVALSFPSGIGLFVFLCCAALYSQPPMQLRRFFAVPQFLMAIASIAIFTSGYLLVFIGSFSLDSLRLFFALGFFLFGLWFLKDIPDFAGDRAAGYDTVMTRFGPVLGKRVAYGLFFLGLFLGALFLL